MVHGFLGEQGKFIDWAGFGFGWDCAQGELWRFLEVLRKSSFSQISSGCDRVCV